MPEKSDMAKLFNIIPGADGAACLLLYGDIGTGARVDAADVVAEIMSLQAVYSRIDVRINSYGGEVYAGIAICNALRSSTADINIYVDGIAASIASVIALCGKPLHMSRYARLMLHQVSGSAYGTADEMRRAAQEAESAQRTLAEIIAGKCGRTVEDITAEYFSGGDHWLTAAEAKEMGLADSIYDMASGTVPSGAAPEDIYRITNRLAEPQKTEDMALMEELRKRTSFSNASSEQEVLSLVSQLEERAAQADSLRTRVDELENALSERRKASHKALVDQAVADGRMAETQRDTYMRLLDSDEEAASALIASLPRKTRINDVIGKGGVPAGKGLEDMTWDEIDRAGRLAELKNGHPELYRRKFDETFRKN